MEVNATSGVNCVCANADITAHHTNVRVNPLTEKNVLQTIENVRKDYPEARIILLPHWDYELEVCPMPMHRELAHKAIDAGTFAIIGHHPHCIQDIEIYRGRPICYSIGNWFIPSGVYMNGNLKFPSYTYDELAVELNAENFSIHKYSYSPEAELTPELLTKSSNKIVANNDNNNCLTNASVQKSLLRYVSSTMFEYNSIYSNCKFDGLTNKEYRIYFAKNRKKRKILPIFYGQDTSLANKMKAAFVKIRQVILRDVIKHKIRRE